MDREKAFERLSEIQDEIVKFSATQVGSRVDRFFVQGKVTEDDDGNITGVQGNVRNVVVADRVLDVSEVLDDPGFKENVRFVRPRVMELHDVLRQVQGKSPVRFRWAVDMKTGHVESEWTYYDDLTPREKENDFWRHFEGDIAWKEQLQIELVGTGDGS